MVDHLRAAPLPRRDPVDLARRLRGLDPSLAIGPATGPRPHLDGYQERFWIVDQQAARVSEATATLRLVTPHAYWFVEDGYDGRAPQNALAQSADAFESQTYPAVRRYFGSEPNPGVDGDPHLVFFLGHVPGVAAYFSGADSYPRSVNPRSNERDMIYVNLDALRPGQPGFDGTLAHEFQHMVLFAHCPDQETWVDEGAADLATQVAGFGETPVRQFVVAPDVQLTAWTNRPADLGAHYQAAYLFLRYFADRFGGWDALPDVLGTCARGPDLFDHYLAAHGAVETFDDLFGDWTVANFVDDRSAADGRYGYATPDVHVSQTLALEPSTALERSLPQYAADYVELPPGASVRFQGTSEVLPIQAAATGPAWWSNRADSLDSTLTRTIDLRGVDRATAQFRAWYETEENFDFVYLVASRDGGATWQVLPGQHTVDDRAMGNAFGSGWTGISGSGPSPAWIDESVDLSPVAGNTVLLRFEYLTDQGYNARGFAFDDFQVPEIGLRDGADGGPWTANGWVRVTGPIRQPWSLRLAKWDASGAVSVAEVAVDRTGAATITTDPSASRTVLVIAPTAFRTLEPASYGLTAG